MKATFGFFILAALTISSTSFADPTNDRLIELEAQLNTMLSEPTAGLSKEQLKLRQLQYGAVLKEYTDLRGRVPTTTVVVPKPEVGLSQLEHFKIWLEEVKPRREDVLHYLYTRGEATGMTFKDVIGAMVYARYRVYQLELIALAQIFSSPQALADINSPARLTADLAAPLSRYIHLIPQVYNLFDFRGNVVLAKEHLESDRPWDKLQSHLQFLQSNIDQVPVGTINAKAVIAERAAWLRYLTPYGHQLGSKRLEFLSLIGVSRAFAWLQNAGPFNVGVNPVPANSPHADLVYWNDTLTLPQQLSCSSNLQ